MLPNNLLLNYSLKNKIQEEKHERQESNAVYILKGFLLARYT